MKLKIKEKPNKNTNNIRKEIRKVR